jgi:hypothetical protein
VLKRKLPKPLEPPDRLQRSVAHRRPSQVEHFEALHPLQRDAHRIGNGRLIQEQLLEPPQAREVADAGIANLGLAELEHAKVVQSAEVPEAGVVDRRAIQVKAVQSRRPTDHREIGCAQPRAIETDDRDSRASED